MSFTIFPAIDLRTGRVVRLKEGDPARMTAYSDDPAETARRWLREGASWLHVVNLDGAFGESNHANHSALKLILNVAKSFGAQQIAVGIDARDGMVRVRGWKDNSGISATDLALHMRTLGLRTVIFTDVRRDGLGSGLNIDATRELAEVSNLDVIASGGVHTLDDVTAARDANLSGVIIGRALYEGTINLKDALEYSLVE